jgi:hypothetical protein
VKAHSKSAAQALAESPLGGLLEKARALDRISSAVARFLGEATGSDPLSSLPQCSLRGRTVVLTVASASEAAKLRQRTAALQHLLQERDPDLTGIRIRLQPAGSPEAGALDDPPPAHPARRPADRAELAAALAFAEELVRDLPESPLRQSATRLRSALRARLREAGET